MKNYQDILNTVHLVIVGCLDSHEFVIFGLFVKSRIRELTISIIGSDERKRHSIIIIFARFLSLRICSPLAIREKLNLANNNRSSILFEQSENNVD